MRQYSGFLLWCTLPCRLIAAPKSRGSNHLTIRRREEHSISEWHLINVQCCARLCKNRINSSLIFKCRLRLKLINLAIRRHETSLTYESLRIKVRSSVECVKIQVTLRVMWVDWWSRSVFKRTWTCRIAVTCCEWWQVSVTFAFLAQPVLVVAAALLVDFPAAALSSLAAVSAVAFLLLVSLLLLLLLLLLSFSLRLRRFELSFLLRLRRFDAAPLPFWGSSVVLLVPVVLSLAVLVYAA